jgi:hypothetical protein
MNLQIAPLVKIKYQYDTNIKEGHPIDGRQLNLYLEIIVSIISPDYKFG